MQGQLAVNRRAVAQTNALSTSDCMTILVLFLLPIPSVLGDATARWADAVRFGSVAGHLLLSPAFRGGRQLHRTSLMLLLMFAFACLSMMLGVSHTFRDLLDVMRIIAFWTVFLLGAFLAFKSRGETDVLASFSKFMLALGVLNAGFSLAQFYFPVATEPLQSLYTVGEYRYLRMELISEQGRAIGFFANPNTNAVMLLLLSLPSWTLYRITSQPRYLLCGIFTVATIPLTGSRSGLILLAAAVIVHCVASRKIKALAVLSALSVAAYFALDYLVRAEIIQQYFPYLGELLLKVHGLLHGEHVDIESISSYSSRLWIWEETLEWYRANPLFGSGPLREQLYSYADNYYVYLLSRYGIVGLALYTSFSLYLAVLCIKAILSNQVARESWGLTTLTALVIVNLANYTIDAFLIVPIACTTLLYAGYLACLMDIQPPASTRPARTQSISAARPRQREGR